MLQAPYFDTKRAAEAEVEAGLAAGLDAVTVNPAAIYGPSLAASNSSKVLVQILRGRMRFVPPGGVNVVPLDTVVDGCLAAARRGATGRRYILGGENLTLAQLVERVSRAGGKSLRARELPVALGPPARFLMDVLEPFVPDRVWFTPDMASVFGRYLWFDSGRAERELGVVPTSLDACLEATVRQLGVG